MGVGGLNLFGLHQYDGLTSFFGDGPPLSQGVGYGIVVGFGAAFAVLTTTLVYLDYKYGGTKYHSEVTMEVPTQMTLSSTHLQLAGIFCQSSPSPLLCLLKTPSYSAHDQLNVRVAYRTSIQQAGPSRLA